MNEEMHMPPTASQRATFGPGAMVGASAGPELQNAPRLSPSTEENLDQVLMQTGNTLGSCEIMAERIRAKLAGEILEGPLDHEAGPDHPGIAGKALSLRTRTQLLSEQLTRLCDALGADADGSPSRAFN